MTTPEDAMAEAEAEFTCSVCGHMNAGYHCLPYMPVRSDDQFEIHRRCSMRVPVDPSDPTGPTRPCGTCVQRYP